MKSNSKILISIVLIIITAFLFWYFRSIVIYVAIAGVLALLGEPLVDFFNRLNIGRFRFNQTGSALLALLIILSVLTGLISAFIPLLVRQARTLMDIDPSLVFNNIVEPLLKWEFIFNRYQYYLDYNTVQSYFQERVFMFFDISRITYILNRIAGLTGDLFIAVFSVSFITFFFLKDRKSFYNLALAITPVQYEEKVSLVLLDIKRLLTRYFIGVFIQVLLVILFITLGLSFFGFKNALLIGFIAGILNVVPYVGPLIGALLGVVIAVSTGLETTVITGMLPSLVKVISVFAVVQLIDNFLFQPVIYSNSIKAHPLEIFFVILAAGKIAGIGGIVLAIPVYTILRVIGRQFLNHFMEARKLKETM